MIKLNKVSKGFGAQGVLSEVTFTVTKFAGVVGPNGCGKTTLLNIVAGEMKPDDGSVELSSGMRPGYLRQGYADVLDREVGEVFRQTFTAAAGAARLEELARRMAGENDDARRRQVSAEYDRQLAELESAPRVEDVEALMRALSLRRMEAPERVGRLSGGEQSKLGLIELVLSEPSGLLLDEPTNNLDLPALEWLDRYLRAFEGAALVVSHDRALLDMHAEAIIEIDPETGRAERFAGKYTAYAEEKARREAAAWARYRQQVRKERQVRQEIRRIKGSGQFTETRTINDHYRRKAKKVAKRATAMERRLERELASEEHIERPSGPGYGLKADIEAEQRSGDRMLAVSSVSLAVAGKRLLSDVSFEVGWGERVVLMGANGSGKTVLVRAIQGLHPLSEGSVRTSPSARIGYLPQEDEAVAGGVTPLEAIRAISRVSETEVRKYLHRFLFSGDDALTPIARLSYGERRRLALARLVLSGANLLLLDEPTNHLDIGSREAFEAALREYSGAVLVVTHDRYFIERFGQRVMKVVDGAVLEADRLVASPTRRD